MDLRETRAHRWFWELRRKVWHADPGELGRWDRLVVQAIRSLGAVYRDFARGELNLRAMGLVYSTLLALVPLLAVSFSLFKAFGVHNQLEPFLYDFFLKPLGPRGDELAERLVAFVDNMQVGVLGSVGLALLIYTVIALIQKIEEALNYTWHVTRLRSFAQRFSGYMSVLLVGPVLMVAAIGFMASIRNVEVVRRLIELEPVATLVYFIGQLVPYLLIIGAFSIVYILIPNTRVRVRSALVGGVVAGVLWKLLAWALATFIVTSTRYTAIYSGFAILLFFIIWLYLNWLTLLVGADIAYYHQHPQALLAARGSTRLSNRLKEQLAVLVMVLVGMQYHTNGPAWTREALVERTGVSTEAFDLLLGLLVESGLLIETAREPVTYLPGRDMGTLTLAGLLETVRSAEEGPLANAGRVRSLPAVDDYLRQTRDRAHEAASHVTLKDLVLEALASSPSVAAPRGYETPGNP